MIRPAFPETCAIVREYAVRYRRRKKRFFEYLSPGADASKTTETGLTKSSLTWKADDQARCQHNDVTVCGFLWDERPIARPGLLSCFAARPCHAGCGRGRME